MLLVACGPDIEKLQYCMCMCVCAYVQLMGRGYCTHKLIDGSFCDNAEGCIDSASSQ